MAEFTDLRRANLHIRTLEARLREMQGNTTSVDLVREHFNVSRVEAQILIVLADQIKPFSADRISRRVGCTPEYVKASVCLMRKKHGTNFVITEGARGYLLPPDAVRTIKRFASQSEEQAA